MRHLRHGVAVRNGERDEVGARERRLAAVATRQHGVISAAQLAACGFGRSAIRRRVAQGRLHRMHRGVYLVGHPVPASLALETAAVLAVGSDAVLSHRTAAALWRIAPAVPGPVDVTVVGRQSRQRAGLRVHRVEALNPHEVRRRGALRLTAPARTLLDLAAVVDPETLERAVAEAEVRRLVGRDELVAAVESKRGSRGLAALRRLVEREGGPKWTRSEAEATLLALVRTARLPEPELNARIGRWQIDFLWRQQRLAVELDGYAYHSSRAAFERDRRKTTDLQHAGLRVERLTWRRLDDEPHAVLADIVRALHA